MDRDESGKRGAPAFTESFRVSLKSITLEELRPRWRIDADVVAIVRGSEWARVLASMGVGDVQLETRRELAFGVWAHLVVYLLTNVPIDLVGTEVGADHFEVIRLVV